MKVLSIDPSIENVGIVFIDNSVYRDSHTFHPKEKTDIVKRLEEIKEHIESIDEDFDVVLVEMPDAFMRQGRYGIKNVVPIQTLMMAIGAIVASLVPRHEVRFVKVSEWKFDKGKKMTQYFAKKHSGKVLNTHESDALEMAMKWIEKGIFRQAIERNRNK